MDRKVVSCPVEGAWLVNEGAPAFGKTLASGVAVYFHWGRGGWWECERCGAFVNNMRAPCEHVRAVESYEVKKADSW